MEAADLQRNIEETLYVNAPVEVRTRGRILETVAERFVAFGGESRLVQIWQYDQFRPKSEIPDHTDDVRECEDAEGRDGSHVARRVWQRSLPHTANALSLSSDVRRIAIGDARGGVLVYDFDKV